MNYRLAIILLLVGTLLTPGVSWSALEYPSLLDSCDPKFERILADHLIGLGLEAAIKGKRLCVALVDITDPKFPRVATVNGNVMMYAASLPKIAILLGAFDKIAKGEMVLDNETRQLLTSMIRNSSNRAATEMLNRVGKQYIADLLQSPRYLLYDPVLNGGLWIGKDYGKVPAWKRDPMHNLSHGATAMQVARFYYLLETGRLVSPELSKEMKKILGDPGICHKFVKGLEKSCPDAVIYRKSGTWKQYHSDSAIVENNGRRYIAVALAQDPKGGKWLSDIIVMFDDIISRSPVLQSPIQPADGTPR